MSVCFENDKISKIYIYLNQNFSYIRFRGLGPTLIVCPATLMEQWVKHFHDWCPTFRAVMLHQSGTYQGRYEKFFNNICTYIKNLNIKIKT